MRVAIDLIIHRLNDEYIVLVSVPGSLLRSTKEGKLGYFLGNDGSQLAQESFEIPRGIVASHIDVMLECGSTRHWVMSA